MLTHNCLHNDLSPWSIGRFVPYPPCARRPAFRSVNPDSTSHRLFYPLLETSCCRSTAVHHVVYRKMILPAERTPPISVPWTCTLTSGRRFAAAPPTYCVAPFVCTRFPSTAKD